MLSRVLLSLAAACALLVSTVSGQTFPSPQLYCSPVTVDAFAVAVGGTADTEGAKFANVTGGFGTYYYYVPLRQPGYLAPNVFFDVTLTPNISKTMYNSLVTFGFTIQLNGQTKFSSPGNPFFDATGTGVVPAIEFTNWRFDTLQRFVINNTLIVNVTESIFNPAPTGVNPDTYYCNTTYIFIFSNPQGSTSSAGFVTGDPQFKGLRGQSFQVHGVDGAVYNLISDANMQLNSRFTFLEGPRPCPVMPSTGKVSGACWSHPGSYLSELALKTSGGSQLFIGSGEASQGFASVQLNGKNIPVGSTLDLSFTDSDMTGSVTLDNSHEMTIRSALFEVVIENNDGFINLRSVYVSAANWPKLAAHGLLGQTWQNKRYGGKIKEIEGDVDDYLIEDDNMFGDNFLFNKFSA